MKETYIVSVIIAWAISLSLLSNVVATKVEEQTIAQNEAEIQALIDEVLK